MRVNSSKQLVMNWAKKNGPSAFIGWCSTLNAGDNLFIESRMLDPIIKYDIFSLSALFVYLTCHRPFC